MKEIKYSSRAWIRLLRLRPHPEGGYYRETYRAAETIAGKHLPARYGGARSFSTAIYFLLAGNQHSAFHLLKSDEFWHFYAGAPLDIFVIRPGGNLSRIRLGNNPAAGEIPQYAVRAGSWFAAAPAIQNPKSLPAMLPPQNAAHPSATLRAALQAGDAAGGRIALQAGKIKNKLYSLAGCTVAPGFDFKDFETGKRAMLCSKFPAHAALIAKLTPG